MTDTRPTFGKAFLEAQKQFEKPKKSATNAHFKNEYSTLEDDLDAVKDALWDAGIEYHFEMVTGATGQEIKTVLTLAATGESRETSIPLLMAKQDMQQLKSATTYARRIGIELLTGIAPADDDDADANRNGTASLGASMQDAWKQNVMDGLPENATPAQRAKAFADAIIASFKSKTGAKALSNEWDRRRSITNELQNRFPDLFQKVAEEYEARMIEIEPIKHEMDVS